MAKKRARQTVRRTALSGEDIVTAAVLVIGDEILSGRTRDSNINYIAAHLTRVGIRLQEVRIVADDEAAIVAAVDALRARYTYLFTTGGIGPTHDDITADAIAKALGVPIDHDPRAVAVAHRVLRQTRRRADAGTHAHGANSARRRAHRERRFDRAGLHDRQRHCARRRARCDASDAR